MNKTLSNIPPVLLIVFNRPDLTQEVFNKIKQVKPDQLFIAADGPRINRSDDVIKCNESRKIVEQIDWECDLKLLFREENLGCKIAVSSAITWFFENVEAGIILEDDCVPDISFFSFCAELLEKYKDDERIMQINGTNLLGKVRIKESYFFSNYVLPWGWATWRRAWKKYDIEMIGLDNFKRSGQIKELVSSKSEAEHWLGIFEHVKIEKVDTWDHQWHFACWYNNGISITPKCNLISNIGFRIDATHTKINKSIFSSMKTIPINFTIHPQNICIKTKFEKKIIKIALSTNKEVTFLWIYKKLYKIFYTNIFKKIILR
jgi:hypothetical protein